MTGDRVAEIRDRDAAAPVKMTNAKWTMHDGLQAVSDRKTLLAENARLRAQLDTVRELIAPYEDDCPDECCSESLTNDIRAALNQGGETNGE